MSVNVSQERVDVLAERANEGTLTEQERAEYKALIDAADLVAILKRQARRGGKSGPEPSAD